MNPGEYVKKSSSALATIVTLAVTVSVEAEMVCAWHFNELVAGTTSLVADHGEGFLDMSALEGGIDVYDGTDLNALSGDQAGSALGVRGSSANGSWFELWYATGLSMELSFAYRTTATGFDENLVQFWNGGGWEHLAEFGGTTSSARPGIDWERVAISIPGTRGDARLRFVLDGADGANGTIRFDNVQVASVPAPGAWLLAGVGGLLGIHGRARRCRHH